MDCRDVSELLIPYLDGELSEEEREAVELHLSACLPCRKEFEALAATQSKIRQSFEAVASKAPSSQAWARLQQRLAMEEQPKITVFSLAISKFKGGMNMLRRGLVSRPPVWKPALVAVLVAVLIVGLALVIPPYLGQSQEVLAAEIAQNDPQVQELLPEGTAIRVVKAVRPVERGIFHVLFLIPCESIWGEEGENQAVIIDTSVNVRERKVVEVRALKVEAANITPLSDAEREKAIEIAESNPEVQEILNSGAEISRVIPLPFFQPSEETLTIEVVGVVLRSTAIDGEAEAGGWLVEVDLVEEGVINILEYPLR